MFKYSGSKAHDDFWIFLKKYDGLKRRKSSNSSVKQSTDRIVSPKYKLPVVYDKRWRFNFFYQAHKSNISTYDAHGKSKFQY